jgi:hypothetical protein
MKTHFKRSWHSLGLTVMMAVSSLYTSASVPATIGMATASAANDPQITTTSAPTAPDKVGWQDNCSNAIKTTTVKDLDTEKCNCNCDMSVMSGDRPEARAVIDDHPRPAAPIYSSNNYLNSHIALKKWTAALRVHQVDRWSAAVSTNVSPADRPYTVPRVLACSVRRLNRC